MEVVFFCPAEVRLVDTITFFVTEEPGCVLKITMKNSVLVHTNAVKRPWQGFIALDVKKDRRW